nr:integrator complex subunit 6 homolog [Tanacetum cinerariifolium]
MKGGSPQSNGDNKRNTNNGSGGSSETGANDKKTSNEMMLVCPSGWLCDLTLYRYDFREKKITKKRPRGLKAMGGMESESK